MSALLQYMQFLDWAVTWRTSRAADMKQSLNARFIFIINLLYTINRNKQIWGLSVAAAKRIKLKIMEKN